MKWVLRTLPVHSSLLPLFIFISITARAENVFDWIPGKPIAPLPIKMQGDYGFCWAYSYTSLIENYAHLHGIDVELSPLYLGFSVLAKQEVDFIREKKLELQQGAPANRTYRDLFFDQALTGLEDAQSGLDSTAFDWIKMHGAVPEELVHPDVLDLESNLKTADQNHSDLFQEPSQAPSEQFMSWQKDMIVNQPVPTSDEALAAIFRFNRLPRIGTDQVFFYKGRRFNAREFVSEYLGFENSLTHLNSYGEITAQHLDEEIRNAQKNLREGRATEISYPEYASDVEAIRSVTYGKNIFDSQLFTDPKIRYLGKHSVLIVNMLYDSFGNIMGLVVQNSWGKEGVTILGKESKNKDELGYSILTMDYLRKLPDGHRGLSFAWIEDQCLAPSNGMIASEECPSKP